MRFLTFACLAGLLAIFLNGCTSDQMKKNARQAAGLLGGLLTRSPGGAVSSGINLINDNLLGGNRFVQTFGNVVGTGIDAGTGNWIGAGTSGGRLIYNGIKKLNQKDKEAESASKTANGSSLLPSDQE